MQTKTKSEGAHYPTAEMWATVHETRIWKGHNNSPWMKEALWVCCIHEEEKF